MKLIYAKTFERLWVWVRKKRKVCDVQNIYIKPEHKQKMKRLSWIQQSSLFEITTKYISCITPMLLFRCTILFVVVIALFPSWHHSFLLMLLLGSYWSPDDFLILRIHACKHKLWIMDQKKMTETESWKLDFTYSIFLSIFLFAARYSIANGIKFLFVT